MDAAERKEILSRYMDHSRRFEAAALRRSNGTAEVIPFSAPLRELEQEPTMREIEVLQLVADGLVNREIGQRLFLSEETVKSHVRHLWPSLGPFARPRGLGRLPPRPDPLAAPRASKPRTRNASGPRRGDISRGAAPMRTARSQSFHSSHSLWTTPPNEGCRLAKGIAVFDGFYQPFA